ncbi:MAG TPA: ATP phosphoribosyltransferase [Dehalococcoidales bacterium]|nr:ATP phosphoribosyltransferase [Dehalococcoidales bacterium]
MAIKIALPKGRLLRRTAARLQKAGWGLDEYHSRIGFYRPKSEKFPEVLIRVFHEKDIPIQIAMGNYDLGICGSDWVEELMAKYPSSGLVRVRGLDYGEGTLFMASASEGQRNGDLVRIASEYPNLAESFALKQRLSRFSVFPVWGAAEAYPPENADMVLLPARTGSELSDYGMTAVSRVLDFSAFLVANRSSWESKDLDKIVTSICDTLAEVERKTDSGEAVEPVAVKKSYGRIKITDGTVRLALPDGHQQPPTVNVLNRAGIEIVDYPSETGNRRPRIKLDGVAVKVIRPQDMPLQVANGNFDLAVTGRDWLTEHLYQFPSSPVRELLDLEFSKVRLVAVVHRDMAVEDTGGLREYIAARPEPFRVASEYVNIADKYARDNHLGHYRVIPTWGATEAFLPEDADLLIENTETGRTIARHSLKIIDTLFVSTACLIGNAGAIADPAKGKRIAAIVNKFKAGVEA